MKCTLAVAVATLLLIAPAMAHADDASKHARIEEMLKLTKMDETLAKVIEETKGEIGDAVDEQRAAAQSMPPAQAKILNDFQDKVTALVVEALKPEDLHALLVKLYDQTYTEPELEGIVAFYKTAPGQALLSKAPGLDDQMMAMVQQRVTALKPQIDQLSDQVQKDMAVLHGAGAAPNAAAPAAGGDAKSPDAAKPAPAAPAK